MSRKRKEQSEGVTDADYDGSEAVAGTMPATESNGAPRPRWNPVRFWLCEVGDDGVPVRVLGQCRSLRAGKAKVDEYARVLGLTASRVVVYRVRVGYPLPPRPEGQ